MTAPDVIILTLAELGVDTFVVSTSVGPRFARIVIRPQAGVRITRIMRARHDLEVALGVESIRMDIDADGVAIEVPRDDPVSVLLSQMAGPAEPMALPCAVGRDVSGRHVWADLARMPHLLIAGATGTGKSVALNTLITSLISRIGPRGLRLLLIDAKRVELAAYADLAHLWQPVVTEVDDAEEALGKLVALMEKRYGLLAKHGARSIADLAEPWPRYVCVVDELADLIMSSKTIRDQLIRLAQKARAAGIHLVLATQRPSSDVIVGLLKANVPARMALATSSSVDSRVILDVSGAETLLGRGDMLFRPPWLLEPVRLQGAFVGDDEITAVVSANRKPPEAPVAAPEAPEGNLLDQDRTWIMLVAIAVIAVGLIIKLAGGV